MDKAFYSNALYREGEGQHDWLAMEAPELEDVAMMRNLRETAMETKVAQMKAADSLKLEMSLLRVAIPLQLVQNKRTRPVPGHRYRCETGCLLCCEPPPQLGHRINITW